MTAISTMPKPSDLAARMGRDLLGRTRSTTVRYVAMRGAMVRSDLIPAMVFVDGLVHYTDKTSKGHVDKIENGWWRFSGRCGLYSLTRVDNQHFFSSEDEVNCEACIRLGETPECEMKTNTETYWRWRK